MSGPFGDYSTPAVYQQAKPIEATNEQQDAFVEAMLRDPREPFKIILDILGAARSIDASQAAREWPSTEWFWKRKRELLEQHGAEHYLPAKHQVAREVYEHATGARGYADPDTQLKFYKLYADIMEFVKPASGPTLIGTQNVMLVKEHGSDEDWEHRVRAQQAKLVSATP